MTTKKNEALTKKIEALLLTPKQAAKALAISQRKLWAMTASREIAHVRLGRCVRYRIDSLNQFLAEQEKGGDV